MSVAATNNALRGLHLTLDADDTLCVRAAALGALGAEFAYLPAPPIAGATFCAVSCRAPSGGFDLYPTTLGAAVWLGPQEGPLRLRLAALLAYTDAAPTALSAAESRVLPGFGTIAGGGLALGAWGAVRGHPAEAGAIYAAATILAYDATLRPQRLCRHFAGGEAGIGFTGTGRVWLASRSGAALRVRLNRSLPKDAQQGEDE